MGENTGPVLEHRGASSETKVAKADGSRPWSVHVLMRQRITVIPPADFTLLQCADAEMA